MIVKTSSITKSLLNKTISFQPLEDSINKIIDQIMDQISELRDKLLIGIREKFQFYGLSKCEVEVLQALQMNNTENITGHKLWQAHLNFGHSKTINPNEKSILFMQNVFKELKSQAAVCFTFAQQFLVKSKKNNSLYQQTIETFKIYAFDEQIFGHQQQTDMKLSKFNKSNIILQTNEDLTIAKLFFPKKLKSATLIYQSSQQSFSSQKFNQKCSKIPNNLMLCETQFNKKIGGFTPLTWFQSNHFKKDQSGESFIFSLTHKDKFKLQQVEKAIQGYTGYGPSFGAGCDIQIRNNANSSADSYANINKSYFNSNYKYGDKSSWQRFCGNPNGSNKFKVKEWQIWKLEFV